MPRKSQFTVQTLLNSGYENTSWQYASMIDSATRKVNIANINQLLSLQALSNAITAEYEMQFHFQ